MRLVLDTNVLIAAAMTRGACHDLLDHCQREHDLVTSRFILDELEAKLTGKLKVPAAEARAARTLLGSNMLLVYPPALDAPACRDPDDDRVLATALAGECDCLVTGDKDLLVLGDFRSIRILSPSEFWAYEAAR